MRPAKVMLSVAPVASPMLWRGAWRAITAMNTPFQPTAQKPNTATRTAIHSHGQSTVMSAVTNAAAAARRPVGISDFEPERRTDPQRVGSGKEGGVRVRVGGSRI